MFLLCFIVIPQIIAAIGGINILSNLFGQQPISSMIIAGIFLIIAGFCNLLITPAIVATYRQNKTILGNIQELSKKISKKIMSKNIQHIAPSSNSKSLSMPSPITNNYFSKQR